MTLDVFRILVVVFLAMHGLGHGLWFMASWTKLRSGFGDGAWALPGEVTIRSALGRIWGLGALVVTMLFLVGALGLLVGDPRWVRPTNLAILISLGVVSPWLRQAPGSTGVMAVIADLVLMFLLALPLSIDLTTPS
jgi:hypothetical protein